MHSVRIALRRRYQTRPLLCCILFLTAAIQRAVGSRHTPMAWTLFGVLLVWLGLGRNGAWLHAWGNGITAIAVLWLIAQQLTPAPYVWWHTVRDLVCITASIARGVGRARSRCSSMTAPGTAISAGAGS